MSTSASTPASNDLNRRVAIVTGASRGIGAAIAQRLARDGHIVIVNYAGRAADAEAVVQAITQAGGQAKAIQADVSNAAQVKQMFETTVASFGRVDVLVNNAGVMPSTLPTIGETDDATFNRLIDINLRGSFNTLREAAQRMAHGGRIINFSTSVVGMLLPGYAVYAATKSAVETMSKILAKELRGKSITVNTVAPGPTATALFLDGKTPEMVERLSKAPPLERLGTPDDIASVVAFLAGPDGAWVNGQTLRANGGIV